MKVSQKNQSYLADTISLLNFSKGHNSIKNVGGVTGVVMVLVLLISSDCALYLYGIS